MQQYLIPVKFRYHEELKNEIKAIPGSRWDPKNKAWGVPAEMLEWCKEMAEHFGVELEVIDE